MRRLAGVLAGVALSVVMAGSAIAQQWPAYGNYGYGTGFDYQRNPYSYPRLDASLSTALPEESLSIYGNYLPMLYYSGAAYSVSRAVPFESGQAYCQSVSSYLYCADLQIGTISLLAMGNPVRSGGAWVPAGRMGRASVYAGVLSTRSDGNAVRLTGTLGSSDGTEWALDCAGPSSATPTVLTCH